MMPTVQTEHDFPRGLEVLRAQIDKKIASYFSSCVHCGLCAEACLFYTETGDARFTPIYKVEPMRRLWQREKTFWGPLAAGLGIPWLLPVASSDPTAFAAVGRSIPVCLTAMADEFGREVRLYAACLALGVAACQRSAPPPRTADGAPPADCRITSWTKRYVRVAMAEDLHSDLIALARRHSHSPSRCSATTRRPHAVSSRRTASSSSSNRRRF